jgi:TolA-binding protein
MRNLFFLCLIVVTLGACSSEMNNQREIIKGMENVIKKNTSDAILRPLIANYLNYCVDFKEDMMSPIYLYRCAVLYYRVRNYKEAAAHLETIIREHLDAEVLEDAYLTLGMMNATRLANQKRAKELFITYLEKYPKGKGIARVNDYFRPIEEKIEGQIQALLKGINSLPRGVSAAEGTLSQLMFTYANFIKANPDAPLAASYCLKAAQIAVRLDQHLIAIQFLDKIYTDYPDFSDYPQALLLLAVEYDTNITLYLRKGKVIVAQVNPNITAEKLSIMDLVAHGGKLYKEIIKRFPDHEVAVSAKNGLKYLGKKTNQVVEQFVHIQDSITQVQTNG